MRLLRTYNPNLRMVLPHHHRIVQTTGQTNVGEVRDAMGVLGQGAIPLVPPEIGKKYELLP